MSDFLYIVTAKQELGQKEVAGDAEITRVFWPISRPRRTRQPTTGCHGVQLSSTGASKRRASRAREAQAPFRSRTLVWTRVLAGVLSLF